MSAAPGLVAPLRLLVVEDNPDDVELWCCSTSDSPTSYDHPTKGFES